MGAHKMMIPTCERGKMPLYAYRSPAKSLRIVTYLADVYRVPAHMILGKMQHKPYSNPRHVAIYFLKELLGMSLPRIGRMFSARHHSTIWHSYHMVVKTCARDEKMRAFIEECRTDLLKEIQ